MSIGVHRSKKGAEWRSLRANLGPWHFMATAHSEGWAGVSAVTPVGFIFIQRHPGRFIVHGGWR